MANPIPQSKFHITLKALIDILIPGTSVKAKLILNENLTKDKYIAYLTDLYHMVLPLCHQMQVAMDEYKKLDAAKYQPVIEYLEHHIKEEVGHEQWILTDLSNLGVDAETIKASKPKKEIINMIGSMYYRIFHAEPCAVLGYMAVSETYPVSIKIIETMIKAANLDPNCINALKQHAIIDIGHAHDMYAFIESFDWSEQQQAVMLDSAKATIFHMITVAATLE